ncbi:MAG TPA: PH domain-containing protein [Planctomycetota bacterium]|nr:PH domain-containing protein [Planctomycetota bacterium]
MSAGSPDDRVFALQRPAPALLVLYAIRSLAALILAPVVFVPLFFRYHTLRYRFDDEGVSAAWGILFRREIHLTYKRIQDIHVQRSLVQRWLGIATVEVQTASGSQSAELSVEGVADHVELRDFLYGRMRGQRADRTPAPEQGAGADRTVELLERIAADLEATRAALERARS